MSVRDVLWWLALCGAAAAAAWRAHRDVATRHGLVRGYAAGRHYAFLGLPYARPPTAKRRFEAPMSPLRWDGIFEATHHVRCPQAGARGVLRDENCLVLNVFTPARVGGLPVLVHIHPGGFQRGGGYLQPPERLLDQNMVVVTVNYRLGALGFLCLHSAEAPGNAGLKDLVAALYWVHVNIASFGGNPADVTLYGTRAGAAAAHFLILSDVTKGLFHKAILESGSAISPFVMNHDPLGLARNTATVLGMSEDKTNTISFFKKARIDLLFANVSDTFRPCVERGPHSRLIETSTLNILQKGNYHEIPIMFTFNARDGVATLFENFTKWSGTFEEFFSQFLPRTLSKQNDLLRNKISDLVRGFYSSGKDVKDKESIMEYIEDVDIKYPVTKSALLHAAKTKPVYLMEFVYERNLEQNDAGYNNVILDMLFSNVSLSATDELVAARLVTLWTNFILHGDPTPITTVLLPAIWLPVKAGSGAGALTGLRCLRLQQTVTMDEPSCKDSLLFWDKLYTNFEDLSDLTL